MIHGSIKKFTEGGKEFTEVSNNSCRGLNKSRRYQKIHGGGEMIHGGIRYMMEGVEKFRKVSKN